MNLAVTEFLIVQVGLLRPFPCQLFYTGNRFPFFLRFYDLFQKNISRFRIFMQVVIKVLLYEIIDEIPFQAKLLPAYISFLISGIIAIPSFFLELKNTKFKNVLLSKGNKKSSPADGLSAIVNTLSPGDALSRLYADKVHPD